MTPELLNAKVARIQLYALQMSQQNAQSMHDHGTLFYTPDHFNNLFVEIEELIDKYEKELPQDNKAV